MLRSLLLLAVACSPAQRAATVAARAPASKTTPTVEATRLVEIEYLPRCLAIDDTHLYWTRSGDLDGSVWRVPKLGGKPQELAGDVPHGGSCVLVDGELWVAAGGKIVAVPVAGGSTRHVADVTGDLVRGPDGVYAANPVTGLFHVGSGGTTRTITVRPVISIAGGDSVVFATEPDHVNEHEYTVWRLDGGVPVVVTRVPFRPVQMARSRDTVFVATIGDASTSELHAVPLAGGRARRLVTHAFGISEMIVDDRFVWWAASDGVLRLPLASGVVELYAADSAGRRSRPDRHALVADTDAVYWLSIDLRRWKSTTDAAIMRARR